MATAAPAAASSSYFPVRRSRSGSGSKSDGALVLLGTRRRRLPHCSTTPNSLTTLYRPAKAAAAEAKGIMGDRAQSRRRPRQAADGSKEELGYAAVAAVGDGEAGEPHIGRSTAITDRRQQRAAGVCVRVFARSKPSVILPCLY